MDPNACGGNVVTDPNVTYKRAFQALANRLGRVPTSRDKEWLELGNEYSRSFRPADEPKPVRAAGSGDTGFSRKPAPQALTYTREEGSEALSGPGTIREGEAAVSERKPAIAAPRVSQGRIGATRGPRGGILALCVVCGQEWEREARRGRPAVKCERCR